MKYADLDLHQRINLKGVYDSFLRIAIERFKNEQQKKIYRYKVRAIKRSGKWVLREPHTKNLYNSFRRSYRAGLSGKDTLTLEFLLYGRFVDMGVGRDQTVNYTQVRRRYGAKKHNINRRPKRWYSKRKRAEEIRLNEILRERFGMGLIKLTETYLTGVITIPFS